MIEQTPTADHELIHPLQDAMRSGLLLYTGSCAVASGTQAVPNHCYWNAWQCMQLFSDRLVPDGQWFVEGWMVLDLPTEVLVVEHGWCECHTGQILDPTIVLFVGQDQAVYYSAGIRRSWKEIEAREETCFPRVRFDGRSGEDGMGHHAYKAAYEVALQQASLLAAATNPARQVEIVASRE